MKVTVDYNFDETALRVYLDGPARYLLSEIHGALTAVAAGSHDSWVTDIARTLLKKIVDSDGFEELHALCKEGR